MDCRHSQNRRILIVDDNTSIHDDFRKILVDDGADSDLHDDELLLFGETRSSGQRPNFELTFADQGKTAVTMAAEAAYEDRPFSLAFVDMRVPPGWDGVKTILHLWEVDPELHVVICTAFSDYTAGQIVDTLGETDKLIMVKKPFEPEEVILAAVAMTRKWELSRLASSKQRELQKEVVERTEEVVLARDMLAFSLAKLAESRDTETGEHLERIRQYTQILAEYLADNGPYQKQIDGQFQRDLYRSSPLHDIGKVGIPDRILLKPGKLTEDEFEIMKTHAQIGADTLQSTMRHSDCGSFLHMAKEIAAYHHEKFNGQGYPEGLRGDEIPLSARIVSVADVYDALTSDRVYKSAMPACQAREIILGGRGEHFDPAIVDAFDACYDEFLAVGQSCKPKIAELVATE